MSFVSAAVAILTAAVAVICVGSVGYLLFLLGSAALAARRRPDAALSDTPPMTFAVVVPAHNEELVLGATLASLRSLDYPADRFEIVVIADNCTDRTAAIAREWLAHVIERVNATQRGKGFALAEAMKLLLSRAQPADAFVIVDADTTVAPDFLRRMAVRLAQRSDSSCRAALQGRYAVLNADEGWRAALMAGAFDLYNHIKPLGRDRLGLSVGLKGNGMAFTRAVVEAAPFSGDSITEDIDYGLDLLQIHGVVVGYAPDAVVRAQMPTSGKQAASQRERWEGGRYALLRRRGVSLLQDGLRRRSAALIDAAIDLILPPLAEIAALLLLWAALIGIGARVSGSTVFGYGWAAVWLAAAIGFMVYVLAGFKVAGAEPEAYTALLKAPGYALWKFAVYALRPFKRRKRPGAAGVGEEWVRTERTAIQTAKPASAADESAGVKTAL